MKITQPELAILRLIAEAKTDAEIAEDLGIAVHLVKMRAYRLRNKIGMDNRTGMALWAIREGIAQV
jgi:DNA-binding NarL/FixJ family response regulator